MSTLSSDINTYIFYTHIIYHILKSTCHDNNIFKELPCCNKASQNDSVIACQQLNHVCSVSGNLVDSISFLLDVYIRFCIKKDLAAFIFKKGARFSSVVRAFAHGAIGHLLMVRRVVGSILHAGPIELFIVPASSP